MSRSAMPMRARRTRLRRRNVRGRDPLTADNWKRAVALAVHQANTRYGMKVVAVAEGERVRIQLHRVELALRWNDDWVPDNVEEMRSFGIEERLLSGRGVEVDDDANNYSTLYNSGQPARFIVRRVRQWIRDIDKSYRPR